MSSKEIIIKHGYNKDYNKLVKYSLDLKSKMNNVIERTLQVKQAALLEGIVLSDTDNLDDDIKNDFSNSGLSHIMAASGTNVAFIVVPLLLIFKKIRFKKIYQSSVITIILIIFTIVTGSSASVIRAVIMSLVIIYGKLINRQSDVLTSMAFSAFLILLYNPIILYDVGFQLSYAATLAIVLFYSKIKSFFERLPKFLCETIAVSICAQIGVVPILALYFNKISLISIFSNILAVPLSGLIMTLGILMVLLGQIHIIFAQMFAGLNHILLSILLYIVEKSVSIPFSTITIPTPSIILISAYYLMVIGVTLYWNIIKESINFKLTMKIVSIAIFTIVLVKILIPKTMEVSFIDVGQGDSTFITTPQNRNILIDCGGDISSATNSENKIINPFLLDKSIRKIDIIMLSHTDTDHICGLDSIINTFKVDKVGISQYVAKDQKVKDIVDKLKQKKVELVYLKENDRISIENNIFLML